MQEKGDNKERQEGGGEGGKERKEGKEEKEGKERKEGKEGRRGRRGKRGRRGRRQRLLNRQKTMYACTVRINDGHASYFAEAPCFLAPQH